MPRAKCGKSTERSVDFYLTECSVGEAEGACHLLPPMVGGPCCRGGRRRRGPPIARAPPPAAALWRMAMSPDDHGGWPLLTDAIGLPTFCKRGFTREIIYAGHEEEGQQLYHCLLKHILQVISWISHIILKKEAGIRI